MPNVRVRLIAAKSLLAADVDGYSDPYCVLTLGQQKHKSRTEPHNLSPAWNQTFDFQVANPASDAIKVEVYDFDSVGSDDSLGTATVKLNQLLQGQEQNIWVKLEGGTVGENVMAMAQAEAMKKISGLLGKKKKKKKSGTPVKNKGQVNLGITALDFGAGGAGGAGGAYPPQGGAPGGYPPQQGGYPPQQGGYPPQQGGYPPQQGGYPPQQGGYPPQQGGYPPQGGAPGGYPPQQGGYPPQQGGYPPQQGGYPPQGGAPGGYPPQQGGAPGAYPPAY